MNRDLLKQMSILFAELATAYSQLARDAGEQYVDQHTSPLGSRLHCRLVRSGELPGYRAGRRVLVKMIDIDTYLAKHRIKPTEPAVGTQDEDDTLLSRIGGRAA